MSMKRFVVTGHSMMPTLAPTTEVVASSSPNPAPGDIVAFPHPINQDQWLIKRLIDSNGTVMSDNAEDSSQDSSELGVIETETMFTVVSRFDESLFGEACELLADEDDALRSIIDRWGKPPFWARQPGFATLVLLILEQQVSLESGAAMYGRLVELMGEVAPADVLHTGEVALRNIGVTRQKAGYLIGLASAVDAGLLNIISLDDMSVEDARAELTNLKGIGNWTADAYLLSASRRPDMWPVGDRALQVGAAEVLGMDSVPTEEQLEIIGEAWRPIRAAAARLIWHNYLCERGRAEPPDPTL